MPETTSDARKRLSRRRAFLAAFVLSFAAYLIPLFNPHAGLLPLGTALVALAEPSAYALAVALAVVTIQAILAALLYWLLRSRRWLNWLVLVVALPLFVYGANAALLVAVPLAVLVESDRQPETGQLEEVCRVPGVELAQVISGVDLGLERAGEAWVFRHDDRHRARLTMPGCRLVAVPAPPVGPTMDSVAAGGYLLFRRDDGSLAYVAPEAQAPRAVDAPSPGKYWLPVLSNDGRTLVWLERQAAARGEQPYRLRLRPMPPGASPGAGEETIALDLPPRDQLELIGADTKAGVFTLARFRNEILAVGREGQRLKGPVSPAGVYNPRWGFRWLDGGWVAWDGYREEGRARVVWSLPSGGGEVVIPKGRRIESLAVDPGGRYIAVSVETRLSIGSIRSAVFLLRTSDGQEVFRRYLPTLSRIRLAFLGGSHLAMSQRKDGGGSVAVYRVAR
ncbi:hypothetical protein [Pelagibius marinus]|uniref:hypothetical protein n=1 Tax=Pelagibius marinus TaxID=2762760 RepID=UPI0018726720|nr:hypothetical protein [Pelagibius marinus]